MNLKLFQIGSGNAHYNVPAAKSSFALRPSPLIGKGSQGTVTLSRYRDGRTCACKTTIVRNRQTYRETEILQKLRHPNIVTLFGATRNLGRTTTEVRQTLYMEYLPQTLYDVIVQEAPMGLPDETIISISRQLISALVYIHSQNIIHRDIKPQNILISTQDWIPKICDFGSAKYLVDGEPNINYVASRPYRAPELLAGATDYDFAIDIWAMGCVIGEMFRGRPLFLGASSISQMTEITKILGAGTYELYETSDTPRGLESLFCRNISPDMMDLMKRMLDLDPQTRITAEEALQLPIFL